jgi:hypothetical protein
MQQQIQGIFLYLRILETPADDYDANNQTSEA